MKNLPEVAGRRLQRRTLAEFKRAAKIHINQEQGRISPDNSLIDVLCDAVRLAREHADYIKETMTSVYDR